MLKPEFLGTKVYRLEVGDDRDSARTIEFAADGPEAALREAQRQGGGERVVLFEDGRPLASLRLASEHGFWTVGPCPSAAAGETDELTNPS